MFCPKQHQNHIKEGYFHHYSGLTVLTHRAVETHSMSTPQPGALACLGQCWLYCATNQILCETKEALRHWKLYFFCKLSFAFSRWIFSFALQPWLSLSACEIGPVGAKDLADALKQNTTLRLIALSRVACTFRFFFAFIFVCTMRAPCMCMPACCCV